MWVAYTQEHLFLSGQRFVAEQLYHANKDLLPKIFQTLKFSEGFL